MSMTLGDAAKKLRSVVIGLTTEAFENKLTRIINKMDDIHKMVRASMITYLTNEAGEGRYPKMVTGNLVREIAQSGLTSREWTKVKVGTEIVYTIHSWLGIDNNGTGSHTVVTKNRRAPYAHYLNVGKSFVKYNGFFNDIEEKYRATFKKATIREISKAFGSNLTYRY